MCRASAHYHKKSKGKNTQGCLQYTIIVMGLVVGFKKIFLALII